MFLRRTAAALGTLIAVAGLSALGQVVPSATSSGGWPRLTGGLPIVAGGGFSAFSTGLDFNQMGHPTRLEGVSGWVDWNLLSHLEAPAPLRGLGVELEARDIRFGLPASLSNATLGDKGTNLRQDTGMGGVIYHWRNYGRVRPYGKELAGLGSLDFPPLKYSPPTYRHDNRTITALGAGADIRVGHRVWVRADWEYQFWPNLFGSTKPLTPTGITVGAVYDFNGARRD